MTKEKLKFNEDIRLHVPPEQLWKEFQGDLEFEYDHSVYWPAIVKAGEVMQNERRERWVKAGKHYGESEFYLKGGDGPSVGTTTAPAPNDIAQEPAPNDNAQVSEPIVASVADVA